MGEMIKIRNLSGGLHLGTSEDEVPQGALVRSRGIHPISQRSARSRFGGTLIHSLNAHSIFRYKDAWYYGVSTSFYAGSVAIKASLDGSRLAAAKMGPTAGVDDRLFVAGGDELFKIDVSTSIVNDSYAWTASGSGTNEYYLRTFVGNDPALDEPDALLVNDEAATVGTVGSLAAGEWAYDDNDTLGYDTIYVRLSDGTDPDTKADDYIKALYVQNWGISPPEDTALAADGGAGGSLDDGAVYAYRFTYYNSKTGTRSNPTNVFTATEGDDYTKLLLHCEGADASTTFTDHGTSSHTVTAQGNAQIDTAQYKFGSASGLFDGTGDYLTVPDHSDWFFSSNNFTIDLQVRFNALPTSGNFAPFYSQGTYASGDTLYFSVLNSGGTYYLIFAVFSGGVASIFINGVWSTPAVNTWYHIAAIRGWAGSANKFAVCVDGSALTSDDDASSVPNLAATVQIGRWVGPDTHYFNGWMDEIRISKGVARWTENFTAPTAAYGSGTAGAAIDLGGGSTSIDLTSIPESSDSQVDQVELWRTAGGGSTYFLLTRISNGTTTFTDDISDDDLYATELPTDNLKPYAWFDDCFGPHNASMFWITRTQTGEKGRLYYSSIGRAENVEGYINVTSDADPLQKIVGWRGYLGVISQAGMYQILGTNPYVAKPVAGVPGTNNPHTAVVTPRGLIYEANDGVRLFDGSTSRLLNFDAVSKIFRGISAGDLTSFDGVVAEYARGEYFISDASQTLALRLEDLRWRDVGIGCNALRYAKDDDILAASISSTVLDFEDEGTTQDNATNITFTIEPGHVRIDEEKKKIIQNVHVDANANSETLSVYLVIDGLTAAEALAIVNRIAQTLGSDLLTDGDCSSDSFTTDGGEWSYDAGNDEYDCDGSQVGNTYIYQTGIGVTTGNFYEIGMTLINVSAGNARMGIIGFSDFDQGTAADGSYTSVGMATNTTPYFGGNASFVGSITTAYCKEISGVSFSNGSLSILLGTIDDAYRIVNTFPVGLLARIAGVRVTGSIADTVEIFGINIEV